MDLFAELTIGAVGLGLGNFPRTDEMAITINELNIEKTSSCLLHEVVFVGFGLTMPLDVAANGLLIRSVSRLVFPVGRTLAD